MNDFGIWYVLFVRTGMEEEISKFLINAGLNCFIPKMEAVYRRKGCNSIQIQPMFAGYLFVVSCLPQSEFRAKLRELRYRKSGIVRELYYDDEGTSALTVEEQDALTHLLNPDKVLMLSTGIIENDRVIIQSGPLKGYESRIIHIDRHKRQGTLELQLCTRKVEVKVGLEIVQKY